MKKNGFTLIELLAVIIILGVIMLIAIPSVTRYINESRKDTYIDTARQIVKGAIPMVNSGDWDIYDTNTTYYIPASCIPTENALSSPFGEFTEAYVIVGYTGEGYEYYWASVDTAHQGIEMKEYNALTKNDVQPNIESIDTTIGIGTRTDVRILDETECHVFEQSTGSSGGNVVYPVGKTKETVVPGDLVSVGDEEFYVVKHDGNDLLLLTRYNLNVGRYKKTGPTEGIQDFEAKGYLKSIVNANYVGTVGFSNTGYWKDKVGIDYPGIYCNNSNKTNCAYVFDSNSYIKNYLDYYETYLEGKGLTIKNIRLMSLEESYAFKNENEAAWKETSYWLGTAVTTNHVWTVYSNGEFYTQEPYYDGIRFGVRPIIVI